jgi:hypothetical protein
MQYQAGLSAGMIRYSGAIGRGGVNIGLASRDYAHPACCQRRAQPDGELQHQILLKQLRRNLRARVLPAVGRVEYNRKRTPRRLLCRRRARTGAQQTQAEQ